MSQPQKIWQTLPPILKQQVIDDIAAIYALVPPGLDLYVEVPAKPDPTLLLAELARRGARG